MAEDVFDVLQAVQWLFLECYDVKIESWMSKMNVLLVVFYTNLFRMIYTLQHKLSAKTGPLNSNVII